jgi:DNA polymerase
VTKSRGVFVPSDLAPYVTATVHPSSILRAPDAEARALQTPAFVRDLKRVSRVL